MSNIEFVYDSKVKKILSGDHKRYLRRLKVLGKRIEQLVSENFILKSNKLKKIKYDGREYYIYQLTKGIRIFFTLLSYGDNYKIKSQIITIADHNESDKIHQYPNSLESKLLNLDNKLSGNFLITNQDEQELGLSIEVSPVNFILDKIELSRKYSIFNTRWDLSNNQIDVLNKFIDNCRPLIVRGYAGSGKTSITYELVLQLYNNIYYTESKNKTNILYLTLNKNLTNKAIDFFSRYNLDFQSNQVLNNRSDSPIYIDFLDFNSLAEYIKEQWGYKESMHYNSVSYVSQKKFIDEFFIRRSGHRIFKNQPARFWSELRGVLKSNESNVNVIENTPLSISKEQYEQIRSIDSNYDDSPETKSNVLDLLKNYNEWLKSKEYFDEMDILANMLKIWNDDVKKYDYIIVDEVQDFTKLHIKIILKLLNQQTNSRAVFLAGDEHQIIYPSGFRWDRLKDIIYKQLGERSEIQELLANYRSHKNIIDVVNKIGEFRNRYKLVTEKNKREHICAVLNEENIGFNSIEIGQVALLGMSKLDFYLKQEIYSADIVILVVDEASKDKLKSLYPKLENQDNIIQTITDFKGLDAKHIIIMDFFSYNYIPTINNNKNENFSKLLKDITRPSDCNQHFYEAVHCVNLLTVAVTRAKENLYFVENEPENNLDLIKKLVGEQILFEEIQCLNNLKNIFEYQSSVEDFLEQAQNYMEQELFSAAKGSYKAAERINKSDDEIFKIKIKLGILYCEAEEKDLSEEQKINKWIEYVEAAKNYRYYWEAAERYQIMINNYPKNDKKSSWISQAILCYIKSGNARAQQSIQKLLNNNELNFDDLLQLIHDLNMKNDDIVIYSSVLTQIYYQYINKYLKELSNTSSLSRINFNGD